MAATPNYVTSVHTNGKGRCVMSVTCFTSLAHKLSSLFSVAHIVLVMRTGGRAAPFRKGSIKYHDVRLCYYTAR